MKLDHAAKPMGFDMGRAVAARDEVVARFGACFWTGKLEAAFAQLPGSRETVVLMDVGEFLAFAEAIPGGCDPEKIEGVRRALDDGGLADVPYLQIGTRLDGAFQVEGHEGRHRAMVFQERGFTQIPVRVFAADQTGLRWGETDRRPAWVMPERRNEPARPFPEALTYPLRHDAAVASTAVPSVAPCVEDIVNHLTARGLDAMDIARRLSDNGFNLSDAKAALLPAMKGYLLGVLDQEKEDVAIGGTTSGLSRVTRALEAIQEMSPSFATDALALLEGASTPKGLDLWAISEMTALPRRFSVRGDLSLLGCWSWDGRVPDDFRVGGHIFTERHPDGIPLEAWRAFHPHGEEG